MEEIWVETNDGWFLVAVVSRNWASVIFGAFVNAKRFMNVEYRGTDRMATTVQASYVRALPGSSATYQGREIYDVVEFTVNDWPCLLFSWRK